MLFHTDRFALFFLITWIGYWLSRHQRHFRHTWLLLASYIFYMSWDYRFAVLIASSTGIDYWIGLQLAATKTTWKRRSLLSLSLATNLTILGFFKYFHFFLDSCQSCAAFWGWSDEWAIWSGWQIVLPVGISFYTFQTLSYTIDVYQGRLTPSRDWRAFALFVVFFPQLVAGPIVRAIEFLPQLEDTPRPHGAQMLEGVWLFLGGLFKKVVLADTLGNLLVDPILQQPTAASGLQLTVASFAFAFQLYADFSGYSDMARGVAKLFGYELPINFQLPFQSGTFQEFWGRWHMTLSRFFRDYVYIPLGGNRNGTGRMYFNLFLTFTLSGLWHGAGWNFLCWGCLHGCFLIAERMCLAHLSTDRQKFLIRWFGPTIVLTLFAFSLILFRLPDMAQAGIVFWRLLIWAPGASELYLREHGLWILVLALVLHHLPLSLYESNLKYLTQLNLFLQGMLATCAFTLIQIAASHGKPFLYFQF